MIQLDSLPPVADEMIVSTTSLEKAPSQNLPYEEFFAEPNRDVANQTQIDRANGDSSAREGKPYQWILSLPPLYQARDRDKVIQKWEGYVIEVEQDTFRARLVPIVGEGSDQEAEIYLEEVEKEDRALIEPGAVFYWSIGYLDRPSGRISASSIRFRRLPGWTKREMDSVDAKVARLKNLLDIAKADEPTGAE
jgi:hypothetical protein